MRNEGTTLRVNHVVQTMNSAHLVVLAFVLAAGLTSCSKEIKNEIGLRCEIDGADTVQLRSLEGTGIYQDGWVGDFATVTLHNPHHTRLLSLTGMNVQTGMKDESLHLKFEYRIGKIDSVAIAALGSFEKLILLPPSEGAHDTVQFTLSSSKSFVPSCIGTSKDDRTLSFKLTKLGLVDASTLTAKMPDSYEFPRKEESDQNLIGVYKDGWIADSGIVVLHNLEGKSSVEIRGFVPPDVFQKIADLEVRVGSVLLVKQQIPKQNQGYFRSIFQLPEELAASANIPLTLKPSGSFVPAQRGINSDQRRISYQLQFIGLK